MDTLEAKIQSLRLFIYIKEKVNSNLELKNTMMKTKGWGQQ